MSSKGRKVLCKSVCSKCKKVASTICPNDPEMLKTQRAFMQVDMAADHRRRGCNGNLVYSET